MWIEVGQACGAWSFCVFWGAVRLAYSEACENQAFAYGDHVLGLQFHLETTSACMRTMLQAWERELIDTPYIQSAVRIRQEDYRSECSEQLLHGLLDRLALRVQTGAAPQP